MVYYVEQFLSILSRGHSFSYGFFYLLLIFIDNFSVKFIFGLNKIKFGKYKFLTG